MPCATNRFPVAEPPVAETPAPRPVRHGGEPIRRLGDDRRGTLPVELALALPILVLLLIGGADVTWLYIANNKVQRAAAVIADLAARTDEIHTRDVDDLFEAARQVSAPLDFAGSGRAFVSSVANLSGIGTRVRWQRSTSPGLAVSSRIGSAGGSADLGGVLTLAEGEEVIVGEVFLEVAPLFGLLVSGPQRLYVRALQRPRYGTVTLVTD
jgi:Flp pilus assembly protein TadG